MGLSKEEQFRRKNDEHVKYISSSVCNKDSKKPFVFISYKSDNWEIVLKDIVYRLVKDYGLNVYFDGDFENHNSLWIKQFPKNMESYYCKGVIAFINNKYVASYATVMELLYSQTKNASEGSKTYGKGLPVIPINLESLSQPVGEERSRTTGLGIETFDPKRINTNASAERKIFDKAYNQLTEREILKEALYWYNAGDDLSVNKCWEIAKELIAYLGVNENYYAEGMSLEGIVKSIEDACGKEVFQSSIPRQETVSVLFKDGASLLNEEKVVKGVKIKEPAKPKKDGYLFYGWYYDGSNASLPWDFSKNTVESDVELYAKWKQTLSSSLTEGYTYIIFGKEYHAGKRKQGKLMFDVFEALMERHPDKADILTARSSIARVEDVTAPNTKDAVPAYFRGCKRFTVGDQDYYVGTSYGFDAKIIEIKEMLKLCEEPESAFEIISEGERGTRNTSKKRN